MKTLRRAILWAFAGFALFAMGYPLYADRTVWWLAVLRPVVPR